MKGNTTPGFFRYSFTGDLYSDDIQWGLGNTVFATKIYYTLGLLESLPELEQRNMANFIKSFQASDKSIWDPLVAKKAFWNEKLSAFKNHDLNNFFHYYTTLAETRQAISALQLLNDRSEHYPDCMPQTVEETEHFLVRLNWTKPWGAGSHFSHLLFFLERSSMSNKDQLIEYAINWINQLQHQETGVWYKGNPSFQQKVNGAMKILTGLRVINRMNVRYADKMIDLALGARYDTQACDNFNVIYVLTYANAAIGYTHRVQEIKNFARERLTIYREYYWPNHGGFSFFPGRANRVYYNAILTRGRAEPDIHGTTLFLWGISLIAQILNIDKDLAFHELNA